MDTKELEDLPITKGRIDKGKAHVIVELIEYEQDAILSRTIMKKATGSIAELSFDSGQGLDDMTSPFDTYVQLIDGSSIIVVDGEKTELKTGDGILIPANRSSRIVPNGRFKLLLTVIKSGYEDLSVGE